MKVQNVMSVHPVCCVKTDTAQQAAISMDQFDVGIIPVVDCQTNKQLQGVVTDRDLCLSVVALGDIPDQVLVGTCMTANPIYCHQDDSVEKVIALMQHDQLRRIPVVDEEKRLIGMVSLADLVLSHAAAAKIGEMIEHISEPPARPL